MVVTVEYCGECSMPFEYCEYAPNQEKCKKWLEKNMPEMFSKLSTAEGSEGAGKEGESKDGDVKEGEGKESKRQTRGGKKGGSKKKDKSDNEPAIKLASCSRGRRTTTLVFGLSTCGIKLKDASKFFASKFAASASITGDDEILIQGDVKDDLFDILEDKWNVDPDCIEDIGNVKR